MKSEMIEQEVLKRAKRGDLRAFEAMVKRYERQVYSRALRITRNEQDAHEVTQQTFLEAVECLREFDGQMSFSRWLKRLTTRTVLKVYRQRWKFAAESIGTRKSLPSLRQHWVCSARAHREGLMRALTGHCLEVALTQARD